MKNQSNIFWIPNSYLDSYLRGMRLNSGMAQCMLKDIKAILQTKKPTSAPGPDGIMYGILRKLPATHHILATVFTKLMKDGDPPVSWSCSSVSLIHKAGDTSDPQNFRMISVQRFSRAGPRGRGRE